MLLLAGSHEVLVFKTTAQCLFKNVSIANTSKLDLCIYFVREPKSLYASGFLLGFLAFCILKYGKINKQMNNFIVTKK